MPKITNNKDGTASVIYGSDDWLAGQDTTSAGSDYGKMGGNPFMSEVDPLRSFGYVSPGYNGVVATNNSVITRILRSSTVNAGDAFAVSSGTYNSGVGSGDANIQKFNITTNTISTSSFPHTIDHSHTSETGWDFCNYYANVSSTLTLMAFYSFSDATDWDVGTLAYPSTFNDDFMSTIPATPLGSPYLTGGKAGIPHPLIVGDDDVLYMGDRNFLHAFDGQTGADGTFSPAVLTLPAGWVITCFAKTQDLRLAIGAYYAPSAVTTGSITDVYNRGAAKVWIWNYIDLDLDYGIDLKDNYVSELISWSNTIAAFTYGRKTLSDKGPNKLQIMNGTQFEVKKTWGSTETALELPIRGGVDNVGNDLYWNAAGQIMSYTQRPDNGRYILNNLVTVGSTGGMFKFFSASSIYHSSFGITTDGLQQFGTNYNDVGILQAQVISPDFPVKQQGSLTEITIKFKDTVSGGRSFRLNTKIEGSTPVMIGDLTTVSSTRLVQIQTRSDDTPLGVFSSLQPQLIWGSGLGATSCPVVEYIKYDFSLVNVNQ